MTNPLLQPGDRFQRPSVLDGAGRNRFAEGAAADESAASDNPLAAPSDASSPSYQPRYQVAYPHRGPLMARLGGIGFLLSWLLLLAFTDYALLGLAASAVGITLSLATVVMSYQELSGMTAGAVDPTGRDSTLLGFRLALAGLFLGIGASLMVVALMIRGIVSY